MPSDTGLLGKTARDDKRASLSHLHPHPSMDGNLGLPNLGHYDAHSRQPGALLAVSLRQGRRTTVEIPTAVVDTRTPHRRPPLSGLGGRVTKSVGGLFPNTPGPRQRSTLDCVVARQSTPRPLPHHPPPPSPGP